MLIGLMAEELSQEIRHNISSGWCLEGETDPEPWGRPQYLFVQTMLSEHANALAASAKDTEAVERLTDLSRIARELVTLKPVM